MKAESPTQTIARLLLRPPGARSNRSFAFPQRSFILAAPGVVNVLPLRSSFLKNFRGVLLKPQRDLGFGRRFRRRDPI
jgi:hypothetical protein